MANKKIALACTLGKSEKSTMKIDGVAQVYKVVTKNKTLSYWNASNKQRILDHNRVLRLISEELTNGKDGGTVPEDFNEIMFELAFN